MTKALGEREKQLEEMCALLDQWDLTNEKALDVAHDQAKAIMTAAQGLTEFEDGKVSRMLTVVAFLSALVGVVYTRFQSEQPWPGFSASKWVTVATYGSFFAYIIVVAVAVLVLLSAIRPAINAPRSWTLKRTDDPVSVFFLGIQTVTADAWARMFQRLTLGDGAELKRLVTKNYVGQAYALTQRVARRLVWISFGMILLQTALVALLSFFMFYAATIMFSHSAPSR